MSHTQRLDWDSQILGLPVARIESVALTQVELQRCLQKLKKQGIRLVYWVCGAESLMANQAAIACNGYLVDQKITYQRQLNPLFFLDHPEIMAEVYTASTANEELIALAKAIARHSRFNEDPHLSIEQVDKLYTAWIQNACQKRVAKVILIRRIQRNLAGMVVIAEQQPKHSNLSLLAVAERYRQQSLGRQLVCAAQAWQFRQGYTISQVVTQSNNLPARRLYESCGYALQKTDCFYHFWL